MDKERDIEQKEKELFSRLSVEYARSKEDVWKTIEGRIDARRAGSLPEGQKGLVIRMERTAVRWAVAASVLLLIGLGFTAKYYTVSHEVGAGSFATHTLPDGSKVHLNAESEISYHPYWWRVQRRVSLAGEAFFEVRSGKTFSVQSRQGRTEVLGTSFNVYARDEDYRVYCLTGKVLVTNSLGKQVILEPGELAGLTPAGDNLHKGNFPQEYALAWRFNKFVYNTTPLTNVIRDVERHYGVTIDMEFDSAATYNYTGLFERSVTADEALEIICFSFDLEFEKSGDRSFRIRQN